MIKISKQIMPVKYLWGVVCGALVIMATVIGLTPTPTLADSPLPPRPGAELPPRPGAPSPAPPAVIHTADRSKSGSPAGAYIELMGLPNNSEYWTVVQWQDRQGDWHNVDGWQGTLENSCKKWWVNARDFGTGPFRWVVYLGQNGPEAGRSDSFLMPHVAMQTQQVAVTIAP
jgi:hypothetical protein